VTSEPPAELTVGQESRVLGFEAVTLLSIYVFLVMIIPAWLVYLPLGAAGAPSAIFAVVIFCWYLLTWLHPSLRAARGTQPVRRAAILFGCVVLASYVSANRSGMPPLELNAADRAIISACGWLGVLLLAADAIRSMERLNILLRRMTLGGAVLSALAILQFFTGLDLSSHVVIPGLTNLAGSASDLATRAQFHRPAATALSPIELAAVLVMSLPLAVHYARFAPPHLRVRRWLVALVIGAGLPITLSRTGLTALAAVCLVLLPTWPKRDRRIAYVAGLVGAVAFYILIPGLLTAFRNLFFHTSNASRASAFSESVPYITQHPWLGMGPGTFLPQTYFFTDDQYLNALVSIGIIGLLALLALFATGLLTAWNARRATADPGARDLVQSIAASLAASAVAFATLDALAFPIVAGLTFMLIGCIGAAWRLLRAEALTNRDTGSLPTGGELGVQQGGGSS
jgi:O-antigen ligase